MPQGLKALTKGKGEERKLQGVKKTHAKAHSKAKAAKKGNPTQLPKNIHIKGVALERQRITKAINLNAERVTAGRALRAGDTFSMKDVKSIGKELNRDVKRELLSRKKSRVEEKLLELREKMDTAS